MKKTIKSLLKFITFAATLGGIAYAARDQIKEIIDKLKEVKDKRDSDNEDSFDDLDMPDTTKDDRDYVSLNPSDSEPASAFSEDTESTEDPAQSPE